MNRKQVDPEAVARIMRLEAQLAAALQQIEALRIREEAALRIAAWGRPRERRTQDGSNGR